MGQDFWAERDYCAYFSVINPAPSNPDIRKHPSNIIIGYFSCFTEEETLHNFNDFFFILAKNATQIKQIFKGLVQFLYVEAGG